MILAEELALLAYDDEGDPVINGPGLDFGLAGAVLLELALSGRLDVVDGRLSLTGLGLPGDPVLDAVVTQIADRKDRPEPEAAIIELRKGLRERVLDQLVQAGMLRRERNRVLRVFSRTRYPSTSAEQSPAEVEVRERLNAAVSEDGSVDGRTAALCALIRAVKLEREVFPGIPEDQLQARLAAMSEGAWAAEAVMQAVHDVQAAIVAALAATFISLGQG